VFIDEKQTVTGSGVLVTFLKEGIQIYLFLSNINTLIGIVKKDIYPQPHFNIPVGIG